ncbi:MAG: stage V sporulation protein AC [Clostridia bacterium]|nr:stage V sporulation protein AC [Clostridia bacterium]
MNMDNNTYRKFVKARAPKSPLAKDCFHAFLVGGLICAFAQALLEGFLTLEMTEENAKTLVPVTLIFLAALCTGLGVFDDIAKFAGAGTLVPITGFANAVASPAIDDKSEGLVMGVGAQMFTIAGPVIVYGILTSVLYGFCYWIWGMLM